MKDLGMSPTQWDVMCWLDESVCVFLCHDACLSLSLRQSRHMSSHMCVYTRSSTTNSEKDG